jgi:hypothetical protein
MPFDDPGSLTDEEYLDIIAFALFANEVPLVQPLTVSTADEIVVNE